MTSFSSEQRFLVTGASSGIGEGVALLLNELGATVIGIARNMERLEGMKAKAKHPENVFLEQKNLTDDLAGLPQYVKFLREKYGKLRGLAYCAGIVPVLPLRALEADAIRDAFLINYDAPVMMAKGMADKRNNVGAGTSCVFISSVASVLSDKGHVIYSGTKAALAASVRSMAKEYASSCIRFNCVSPSNIRTEKTTEEYVSTQIDQYPMGFGEPSDVANLITFLLSDETEWITAQNYVVDCSSF